MSAEKILAALVGQQNCGKSTLFNALTGLQQHIANYPGVTVDKKSGFFTYRDRKIELVDLPGTYALTSFSPEERVARAFLIQETPDVIVNVVDATNLVRGLYLTYQLMPLRRPMLLVLNMMDRAEYLGLHIDIEQLSSYLGIPVIAAVGSKTQGIEAIREQILATADRTAVANLCSSSQLDALIEPIARDWEKKIPLPYYPARWAAEKILECDNEIAQVAEKAAPEAWKTLAQTAETLMNAYVEKYGNSVGDDLMAARNTAAKKAMQIAVTQTGTRRDSITDFLDALLLHRFLAPFFLLFIIWTIYQLAIVRGYQLTQLTWPILANFRTFVSQLLPDAGFLIDPQIRSMTLWALDSANTLLNYVPIFLILFALIAILEDSGYMARIAFVLDRILHRFGLHGQSTLPLILAGVFAGGCAVPAVMATKGIPDTRARMATILTAPFMNCLAKVPLYTLLVSIYFPQHNSLILFYIATITIIIALLVAKLLTSSVLRSMETAPFVMELPHYHLPSVKMVLRRAFDRTWIYIKKVGTIVLAVATVVYVLLQFPDLDQKTRHHFQTQAEQSIVRFYQEMDNNPHRSAVATQADLIQLLNVYNDYRSEKLFNQRSAEQLKAKYQKRYPQFYSFLEPNQDVVAKKAQRSLKKMEQTRKQLRRQMKELRIENSFLGRTGRALEPVTQFAHFDWKINVALLSSFAARESSVATLGVLFGQDEGENKTLEARIEQAGAAHGYDALTAVALIIFFVIYPPCLATVIVIRLQTGSYRWMLFSIIFPVSLGLLVASLVYCVGRFWALSGVQVFSLFYAVALFLLLVVGFFPKKWARGRNLCTVEQIK